ncbi:MAG: hypothetical protein IAE78_22870 [Myxococcus sp.]|nr:hypothetical protein [Myxococcus sp.]
MTDLLMSPSVAMCAALHRRFLRAEALLEAADLELYGALHETTGAEASELRAERERLGLVAKFVRQRWLLACGGTVAPLQLELVRVGASLEALDHPLATALAIADEPGQEKHARLAEFLWGLRAHSQRAQGALEAAAWGAL